ncbi:MAG: hypothetical protein K2O70_10865, partial [Desulfovibrionaceae bacterium]|nr:hypothetical protein [Desulfovibrionaceae bacterium]
HARSKDDQTRPRPESVAHGNSIFSCLSCFGSCGVGVRSTKSILIFPPVLLLETPQTTLQLRVRVSFRQMLFTALLAFFQ